jgi:muramidase (phage lysozyme)
MCDFWARIKIQKKSVEEMVDDIRESINKCEEGNIKTITEVIQSYWSALGVRDMNRLCEEKSNLYEKIKQVENLVLEQNIIKAVQIPQAQQ